jgi:2-polyprenyl-3-methyl-5-hydroxy-6-metoxy-1,4-benzoquinol methylase
MMNEAREEFWAGYYRELSQHSEPWLDYSNERVQAQTFGVVLAALGPVVGRRALDVGCGYGQLGRALEAIGAQQVTGIDVTAEFVERLQKEHPSIRWQVGSLDELGERLGPFDLITLVEVLQYIPVAATLRRAWRLLAPGGRVVAVVPNRECPIVARAMARFPGKYLPPNAAELAEVAEQLEHCSGWGLQGMLFAEEQALAPYAVSAWTRSAQFSLPSQPNRLVFAAAKAPGPGAG